MKSNEEEIKIMKQQQTMIKVNNLLNQLFNYDYESKFFAEDKFEEHLSQLFDCFIWAEKQSPQLLQQLFQIGILTQIQEVGAKKKPLLFLKNYIIIMMNCCQKGILASNILDYKLPHFILQICIINTGQQQTEQFLEYIGSFLKAYNRIFYAEWIDKFILEGSSLQLLQICCKFYNCPEELTRTTVTNIFLSLLSHEPVKDFIEKNERRRPFYERVSEEMCKQFKNQLAEYNLRLQHISKDDNVHLVLSELEDKVSLWEDISESASYLFRSNFQKQVILPLLIGSIKNEKMPLFTLKFSLLVLNKLIKTIWNFNLLQLLIDILFSADEIVYEYSSLYKAALPPFSVRRLLSTEVVAKEDVEETEEFEGIKNFIYSMIRTKDNHFLMMISALISSLMKEIGKDEKIKEKVGFNLKGNGKVVMRIIEILIQQLLQVHRINTILSVVNSILILSSFQVLCEQMHNLYIHTFRKILDETKTAFKTKSQFWDCLIETLEYDLLFVDNYHFDSSNISKKFENVYQIVFSWDVAKQEEENNYFYSSIPETQSQYFRYMYLKFIVLLKGRSILLEGNNHKYNVYLDYISHNNFYKCPYSVGEKKNFEEFNEPLHCEFIENENRIPCVFIPNHTYIIFGYHEKKEGKVKIMIKAKLKHTSAKLITKKNKIYMQIQIRGYDEKMGRLQIKSRHLIRGIESMLQFIVAKQNGIKERQLQFMTNLMKGTSETLPQINLI